MKIIAQFYNDIINWMWMQRDEIQNFKIHLEVIIFSSKRSLFMSNSQILIYLKYYKKNNKNKEIWN